MVIYSNANVDSGNNMPQWINKILKKLNDCEDILDLTDRQKNYSYQGMLRLKTYHKKKNSGQILALYSEYLIYSNSIP